MPMRWLLFVVLFCSASASAQPPRGKNIERPPSLKVELKEPPAGLVKNPRFYDKSAVDTVPAHFTLTGDAEWKWCGKAGEDADSGIVFNAGRRAGSVSQRVAGFEGGVGKWFRFTFRGLAEKNFEVERDNLFIRIDYFSKNGSNPLDGITHKIYPQIVRDRAALATNGKDFVNGGAIWKTYVLEFRLPFAEIDTMAVGVGFTDGSSKATTEATFSVTEFALTPIPAPADAPKVVKTATGPQPSVKSMIHLGGRWYYNPEPGMTTRPATLVVTAKNAHRLYYLDSKLSNPFAENMTAWLREGHLDINGKRVEKERFLPDNVVLEFKDGKEWIVHARNIPNHPTAQFPGRGLGPGYIQESDRTYYLPLEPVYNPNAKAMDKLNANRALPMGPIGFAVNGVAFFNPFDAEGTEAVNILDRCCGHPAPNNQYHYHKYPVCVKSPFVDDGEGHSPIIGFALDGFPVYGPYVAKGLMAKDDAANPLDGLNSKTDEERGRHYHVTPGKFPYIIGGFAGTPDSRNLRKGPR